MDFAKKHTVCKVDSECRAFNRVWMPKYFFTEVGKKAVCLLCSESVAVLKEYTTLATIMRRNMQAMTVLYQQRNGKQKQQNWTENL